MKQQSATNHTRHHPLQHFVWLPLGMTMLLATVLYTIYRLIQGTFTIHFLWAVGIVVLAIIPGMLARIYALTLQDRLIRTEEQLRYYMLTQKRINPTISIQQLIALRFASDEELVALVERTVQDQLTPQQIKETIDNWRTDLQRV